MCGVKGLSVLALRQAVFETCLPKGDRAISLIGAGSKPASALRKLSAFGVSVLSLREMAVTSIDQSNAKMRFALIIFTAPLASRLYEQRFGTRSRTRQVRCRIWRGLIGEKQILIRIWSNFLVPSLPDTSLCEAQGDGGGPAISCRLSGERQIGRADRRKIDMMFVEPPVATLLAKLR